MLTSLYLSFDSTTKSFLPPAATSTPFSGHFFLLSVAVALSEISNLIEFSILLLFDELFRVEIQGKCWRLIHNWHLGLTSQVSLGKKLSRYFLHIPWHSSGLCAEKCAVLSSCNADNHLNIGNSYIVPFFLILYNLSA